MRAGLLAALLAAFAPCGARATGPTLSEFEPRLQEGLRALYNLDYSLSRARMRALIESAPQSPHGYLFEAGAIWWQSSNEYGLFKDTPALEGLFESDVARALDAATAALREEQDPKLKAEAHFAAGMALGTRGQWNLLRGRWLRAYFDGRKAVKQLQRCLKLDPEFHDAYLGLGIYDYQADRLPGALRLPALFLVRGDAKRGLERMRLAAEKGRFASSQAALFLATIYRTDPKIRDLDQSLEMTLRLRAAFPGSPFFLFLELTARQARGELDLSLRQARGLFGLAAADPSLLVRKQLSLLCGLPGEACLGQGDGEAAEAWLSRALEQPGARAGPWAALLRLYRGLCRDLLGRRQQAVEDYALALTALPAPRLQEAARRCLDSPCDRKEALRRLKAWSLEQGS